MANNNFIQHYLPLNFEHANLAEGRYSPSMVKSMNTQVFMLWERALFQRAASVIDFKNLPEGWKGNVFNFFLFCLYRNGFVAVFETKENGLIFQPGTVSGYNIFYQPTEFIVSNPALEPDSQRFVIGRNEKILEENPGVYNGTCELLMLTPDYFGIWEIISYYAEKLATLDNALNLSIINNKFAFLLAAKNKQASEAFKKMLDKVNAGEPAVIVDQKLVNDQQDKTEPWQFLQRDNLKQNYLTTDQLADFNSILKMFDKEIGIPTSPIEKKERMITDEVNSTVIDAISRSEIWLRTLTESLKNVNEHFNTNITVERHFEFEEVNADESGENNTDRNV